MIDGGPLLQLRNLAASAARLRFRHRGHEVWDIWLSAQGGLRVPDPGHADVQITARYVDPLTRVDYSLPIRLFQKTGGAGVAGRLVAKMAMSGGACSFNVEIEESSRAGELQLLNLTNAEVDFILHYLHTPFRVVLGLPSQAESSFHPGKIEVSATVGGYTTEAMPIAAWDSELAIEMLPGTSEYPVMKQSGKRA